MNDLDGSSCPNTEGREDRGTAKERRGDAPSHIALLIPSLSGGGIARVMLTLAGAFVERGCRVDLVVCRVEGPFRDQLISQINLVVLKAASPMWARLLILAADPKGLKLLLRSVLFSSKGGRQFCYLPDLVHYLQNERPQVLLSAPTKLNLMAVWARCLARASTRLVVSEHESMPLSLSTPPREQRWSWRFFPSLGKRVYSQADAIVAVSHGVADNLEQYANIPRARISTIYNPIVSPTLISKSKAPLDHPWFQPSAPPVVLGVGRICQQKDFPTLLRAFARVRAQRSVHLMILGETKELHLNLRTELLTLASQLGIAEDVEFSGFVANPFAYMARASVFALSSTWEGLPSVLIEALACGCPVVSTDCPSGPAEILENGKYGPLVPIGDDVRLADAILSVLETSPDRDRLRNRGSMFTVAHATDRYLEIFRGKKTLAESR